MIFLDTSAIYALASRKDPNHSPAVERLSSILSSGEPLLTHNYVLIESFALLQNRLGTGPARAFEKDSERFEIEWVTREIHIEGARRWSELSSGVSFVDCVSFVVMERLRIDTAFAFDRDFIDAGFELYE